MVIPWFPGELPPKLFLESLCEVFISPNLRHWSCVIQPARGPRSGRLLVFRSTSPSATGARAGRRVSGQHRPRAGQGQRCQPPQRRGWMREILVGMNRSSLCSFYKRQTGKTIFATLMSMRIDYACNLLRQHELSVASVCYQCGFNDVPYFNRTFKRLVGLPPSLYLQTT